MNKITTKRPVGKGVRTLFEVPNLGYKGRLSVPYSAPEAFRLSSCPRTGELGSAPAPRAPAAGPLTPPPLSRPRAERLRRHRLSAPSASLSALENLRQKTLAVPPAQVARPRLRREGGRGRRREAGPIPRHFHRERARRPRPPHPLPGLSRLAPLPTLSPPGRPGHPPASHASFRELGSRRRERKAPAGRPGGRATVPKMAEAEPAGRRGKAA